MSSTVYDSLLFRDMFGTPEMREVFSDRAYVGRVIDTETALARAEAAVGLIPADAAARITAAASFDALDQERLRRETDIVGYPILPIVEQLAEQCGDDGGYIHWGRDHPGHHGHRHDAPVPGRRRAPARAARRRPAQLALMVQFGGAAGTLASLRSVRVDGVLDLPARDAWHHPEAVDPERDDDQEEPLDP
ncbi:hypothetical protein [Sinomonas mesophila]|uniref:hypothetical protein n=1 Tax=Sinomonas mesophila TaxID=1531955 RepID=UPI001C3782F6